MILATQANTATWVLGPGAALRAARLAARLILVTTVLEPCCCVTNDHTRSASDGLRMWLSGKESACQCRRRVGSLGQEESLEEEMATHSSILA